MKSIIRSLKCEFMNCYETGNPIHGSASGALNVQEPLFVELLINSMLSGRVSLR